MLRFGYLGFWEFYDNDIPIFAHTTMRLDASRFGILASLVGLVGAEDDASRTTGGAMSAPTGGTGTATIGSSPNSVIQVQNLPTPAIYKPQGTDQIIYFSKGQGISELNVSAIYLKRFKDKITVAMGKMSGTSQTGTTAGSFLDGQLVAERQDQFPPSFFPGMLQDLSVALTA